MFTPSRQDARRFFFDVWAKQKQGAMLTPLEAQTWAIIAGHSEYHPLLDQPERYLEQEWTPEEGSTNPFLHLSLHLAIEEQLSIDQPPGIRALYDALCTRHGEEHAARHDLMECLGEMIWHAQRYGGGPDVNRYITCIRGRLGMGEEDSRRINPNEITDTPDRAD